MGEVKWFGAVFDRRLVECEKAGLQSMAEHLRRAMREMVGVSAGGASRYAKAVRRTKGDVNRGPLRKIIERELRKGNARATGRKKAKAEYHKYRHSLPGEPPRKITGFGQRNIVARYPADNIARVGLFRNGIYLWFLDQGVRGSGQGGWRIAPRPWMRRTLTEQTPALEKIAGAMRVDSSGGL